MRCKLLVLTLLCSFLQTIGYAQSRYDLLEISGDVHTIRKLQSAGIFLDHVHGIHEKISYIFNTEERQVMDKIGVPYSLLIEDYPSHREKELEQQMSSRNDEDIYCNDYLLSYGYTGVTRRLDGSVGGFLSYQEMIDEMDLMRRRFPRLVTRRDAIDRFRTFEGRPILYMKISDNPGEDEASEPKMLITGLHHAREAISMQQAIYTMWYFLENYATDSTIRNIVDNTELYFVPCLNPDGYVENILTNPNGGGTWRKNKRALPDGQIGVDLNRNYGFNWGDDAGSSPNTFSDTYRGEAPFSEPETQAIKWLCEQYDFDIALNYHSYGEYLFYPWGNLSTSPDYHTSTDQQFFEGLSKELTAENKYTPGVSEDLLYVTSGDADDWMYGERESKSRIYSVTPEMGHPREGGLLLSAGWWPDIQFIEPQCQKALIMNLKAAQYLGSEVKIERISDRLINGEEFEVDLRMKWLGLDPFQGGIAKNFKDVYGNISQLPSNFQITPEIDNVSQNILRFGLRPNRQIGEAVAVTFEIDNGVRVTPYRIDLTYYPEYLRTDLIESNETLLSRTGQNGGWGLATNKFYSGPYSLTDSPLGNYSSDSASSFVLGGPILLSDDRENVMLTYKVQWDLFRDLTPRRDATYDFAQMQISTDGINYVPLCTKHGLPCAMQGDYRGQPVYYGTQDEWLLEEIDLREYAGMEVWIRCVVVGNAGPGAADGIFLDDIYIDAYSGIVDVNEQTQNEDRKVEIYPNPAHDLVTINISGDVTPSSGLARVEVLGILGHTINARIPESRQNSLDIDVSGLTTGIYLTRLSFSDGTVVTKRFVKK